MERVRIDRATLEPRVKVIGCDLWSDHPDFATQTAATGVTGVCGSGIIEALAEMYLCGILTQDGVIDGGMAAGSDRIVADGRTFSSVLHRDGERELRVTQSDAVAIGNAILAASRHLHDDRDAFVERDFDVVDRQWHYLAPFK